jgi:anti-sigma factor RsiW
VTAECRAIRERADAFLTEQLLIETTQDIVRHLEGCPACRAEFEARRRLRSALKSSFEKTDDLQPRAEFVDALRARLAEEAATPGRSTASWRRWGAMAAGLLLVVSVGLVSLPWLSTSGLAALARLAVGDHENCALTFSLAEEPITLEQAARRYDAAFRELQTVEPATAALPGGPLDVVDRHSCVWQGVRFAHLVLRYKDTLVSVVVASDAGATASWIPWQRLDHDPAALAPVGDQHVASFRGGAHTVFVVSSLPDHDVQAVAQAMAGPVLRALAGA